MHCHGLVNLEPLRYKFMALWTVYEMACFFVTLDGNVPVTLHYKFQQSVHRTVVVPRPQFIYGVGQCSYVPGIPLLLTVQKTVEIPVCSSLAKLLSSRCCATTGAGLDSCLVEVLPLQFIDGRRYLCCGGPDSAWRGAAVAVFSTVVEIPVVAQRQFGVANCAKTVDFPRVQFFFHSF